jgi:hypothetical protein
MSRGQLDAVATQGSSLLQAEAAQGRHRHSSASGRRRQSRRMAQRRHCIRERGHPIANPWMRPRAPVVPSRDDDGLGGFLQNVHHIDGKQTIVVRALRALHVAMQAFANASR